MAVQDKYANEVMSDEELDKVAGGTYEEWEEIVKFFPTGEYSGNGASLINSGGFSGKSYKSDEWILSWIKNNLNIDAEIHFYNFWPWTDADPNVYKRNGESLTHEQVVKEIRAKRGSY